MKATDREADSALKVKGIRGVPERQSVASALRAPVVERRIGARVLQVTGYSAVNDDL